MVPTMRMTPAEQMVAYVKAVRAQQKKDAADQIAYVKAVRGAAKRRAARGAAQAGLGAFEFATIDWKQVGVGGLVGLGLGYVVFAKK